jgi:hypothetical protein
MPGSPSAAIAQPPVSAAPEPKDAPDTPAAEGEPQDDQE